MTASRCAAARRTRRGSRLRSSGSSLAASSLTTVRRLATTTLSRSHACLRVPACVVGCLCCRLPVFGVSMRHTREQQCAALREQRQRGGCERAEPTCTMPTPAPFDIHARPSARMREGGACECTWRLPAAFLASGSSRSPEPQPRARLSTLHPLPSSHLSPPLDDLQESTIHLVLRLRGGDLATAQW